MAARIKREANARMQNPNDPNALSSDSKLHAQLEAAAAEVAAMPGPRVTPLVPA